MTLYNIVFDTSALMSENFPDLSAAFRQLSEYANTLGIKLYIPDIVLQELQQKFIDRTNDSFKKIQTEQRKLKKIVQERIIISLPQMDDLVLEYKREIDRIIQNINLIIIPMPSLSARELIDKAVRRVPPFEIGDKGFRDSMIIESIIEYGLNNNINKFMFVAIDKIFENQVIERVASEKGINLEVKRTVDEVNNTIFKVLNKMQKKLLKEKENRAIAFLNTKRNEIDQYIITNFEVPLYEISGLRGRAVSMLDAKIRDITSAVWEQADGDKIDISFNADVEVTFLLESLGIDIWGRTLKIEKPSEINYNSLSDIAKATYGGLSDFLKNAGDSRQWEEKKLMKTKGEAEVEKANGELRNFRIIFVRPLSKIFGEL
jgi:hypothetical protein